MIDTITLYTYDTISFKFLGELETTDLSLNGQPGYTADVPPPAILDTTYVYTAGVGPWLAAPASISVTELIATADDVVDSKAQLFRSQYMTINAAQVFVYNEKYIEAAAYTTAAYPSDLTGYPYIQADVTALSITSTEAADRIVAQHDYCVTNNAKVEEYRLQTKQNLASANTRNEITTILDTFDSLLTSIPL